jgi:PTS system fructose-specific IIC component
VHGGVFVVPLTGKPLGFLVAVVAGTIVAMVLVVLLTTLARRRPTTPAADIDGTAGTSVTERETAGATA